LVRYYGTREGVERRMKRKPSGGGQSKGTTQIKVGDAEIFAVNELKARSQQLKLKKEYAPNYKNPLASSKLEMLKSIRKQRVARAPHTKTNEALERAK